MEMLIIDSRSTTPVYLQIVEQIRARIGDGSLPPGTPLPSVRQLAAELGINPNTVAKATMLLERDGLVRTVPRRGMFVAEGARERAIVAAGRGVEEAVDRLIEEANRMGVDSETFLAAMMRRLKGGQQTPSTDEGSRS